MLFSSFNLSQSFNYTPYLFDKTTFKSEINSFSIWTQEDKPLFWEILKSELVSFSGW